MEKTASLLTGSPSSFEDFSPLTRITTIWPRPFGSYEVSFLPSLLLALGLFTPPIFSPTGLSQISTLLMS